MKKSLSFLGFSILIFFFSCSPEEITTSSQDNSIDNARRYYESNKDLSKKVIGKKVENNKEIYNYIKNIRWDKAIVSNGNEGEIIEVPISLFDNIVFSVNEIKSKNEFHRLMFFKDNEGNFKVFYVLIRPDSGGFNNFDNKFNYYNVNFNGAVLVFDDINNTRTIRKFKNLVKNKQNSFSKTNDDVAYTCTFYGYWYEDGSFEPISVVGCSTSGSGTGGTTYGGTTGGGSGGSGSGTTVYVNLDTSVLVGARTPITDIAYYLQCFNLSSGATIVIYVDQPVPNSSTAYAGTGSLLDPADVGHTFIAIQQGNIRRVFGFYPDEGVNPYLSTTDVREFGEDGNHHFDVSIAIPVTPSQLLDVIGYTFNAPSTYNLNTYNCTDFAMNISSLAGVPLASAYGTWPNGGGDNPGKLGENIRTMQLPSGVIRQVTGTAAAANKGTCVQQ